MVGELAARCQVCNRKIYGFFTVQPRVYLTVCVLGGGVGGGAASWSPLSGFCELTFQWLTVKVAYKTH